MKEIMDIHEKEKHLYEALMTCIEHYVKEYDITYAQLLGMLDIIKAETMDEYKEEE